MPDKRKHRGPHPEDAKLFAPESIGTLREALADYCMLLTKGYAPNSSLKLVGDRFALTQRQRLAIMRSACSDEQLEIRKQKQIDLSDLKDQPIVIDGYNLLITTEAAISAAPIFIGPDGCPRDISGIHGSYRKVTETIPALQLIAKILQDLEVKNARWLFDSPVSNSGKLKTLIRELAEEKCYPWTIDLLTNPDKELIATDQIAATSDSNILDNCKKWTNLTTRIIKNTPKPNLISLSHG